MSWNRLVGVVGVSALTLGLLTAWGPASPGQAPADKPAGKQVEKASESAPRSRVAWEYKTFYGGTTSDDDGELSKLGDEGWELVGFGSDPRNMIRYVFKREKRK